MLSVRAHGRTGPADGLRAHTARFRPVHDDGYFDERVAARYDESAAEMFDPAVVDPVVDFLAGLAGSG